MNVNRWCFSYQRRCPPNDELLHPHTTKIIQYHGALPGCTYRSVCPWLFAQIWIAICWLFGELSSQQFQEFLEFGRQAHRQHLSTRVEAFVRQHENGITKRKQQNYTDYHRLPDTKGPGNILNYSLYILSPEAHLRDLFLYKQCKCASGQFRYLFIYSRVNFWSTFTIREYQQTFLPTKQATPSLRNSPLVALAWPFYPEYSTSYIYPSIQQEQLSATY